MTRRKSCLLFLYPGPSYRPLESFGEKLKELSIEYHGTLVTTAPSSSRMRLHGFDVICVMSQAGKLATLVRLIATVISVSFRHRKTGGIDLIVTYDPLRSGLLALLAKVLTGAKFAPEVNGDYNNPANYHGIKFSCLRRLKRFAYVFVERRVLNRADGIKLLYSGQLDTLSIDTREKVVTSFFDRSKIEIFHNYQEEPYILSVGFPWYVKGMDISIKAFQRICGGFPQWKLKIIGWYPDPSALEKLIGSTRQIELLKPVDFNEMPDIVGNCGFMVLASRTESMGRVLIEAMAAGKARIATEVGGIPTVVNDGVDGLLIPPRDVGALADAMTKLMSDSDLRKMLGSAGKKRAGKEFSREIYYDYLSRFYAKILAD